MPDKERGDEEERLKNYKTTFDGHIGDENAQIKLPFGPRFSI